jgi:hypothetical protein
MLNSFKRILADCRSVAASSQTKFPCWSLLNRSNGARIHTPNTTSIFVNPSQCQEMPEPGLVKSDPGKLPTFAETMQLAEMTVTS